MTGLRERLLATFQIEHREHVEQIRALVAQVSPSRPALDEAFRRAHSLKGAARAVDLRPIEALAHRLETLFSRVREGALGLDEAALKAVCLALDASEDLLAGQGDDAAALAALNRLLGLDAAPEPAPESGPGLPTVTPVETLRLSAENLDRLMRSAAELVAESYASERLTRQLEALERQVRDLEQDWRRVRDRSAVERRLREVTAQVRATHRLGSQASFTLIQRARRLQQDAWHARMTTAAAVFEGFRKMVRDLARDERKEVEFQAEGLETQADRVVLDGLKDPVMHLLRNAVGHGIEPSEERVSRGKLRVGRITLRLTVRGSRLEVRVEDDGRGIDGQAVAEAAIRRRLLPAAEAGALPAERIARLIFAPGLSTSRVVTELAGRGMGLSVVSEQLRRLQGEVEVETTVGSGTVFKLSLPLTVATYRLLLVSCGGQTLALPVHAVRRVFSLRLGQIETVAGRPVLNLENRPVPVASLGGLLGLAEPAPAGARLPAVLLRSAEGDAAVLVDGLLEQREAVIQELGLAPAQRGLALGVIVLEDGTAAVVLDPAALREALEHGDRPPLPQPAKPASPRHIPTVLVVDDSITTRSLEKSILEAHGYQVRVAVDGVEALRQLRLERPDVVIADIQMPRLDGFGLLEEMKKDPRLSSIPVVLVTSLERREDQERGLALGAGAYIIKRKFDQRDLLDTIRQMV